MKMNMDRAVIAALAERLADEQPGSVLGELRQRLDAALEPKPGQPLSGDELDEVLILVQYAGQNETWANEALSEGEVDGDLLKSAGMKLEQMLRRQRDREDQAEDEKRGNRGR